MEGLIDQFHSIVKDFRLKRHDLLAYHNNKFDRDYVEFNVKISDLECSLQARHIAVYPFLYVLFAEGIVPRPTSCLPCRPFPYRGHSPSSLLVDFAFTAADQWTWRARPSQGLYAVPLRGALVHIPSIGD